MYQILKSFHSPPRGLKPLAGISLFFRVMKNEILVALHKLRANTMLQYAQVDASRLNNNKDLRIELKRKPCGTVSKNKTISCCEL